MPRRTSSSPGWLAGCQATRAGIIVAWSLTLALVSTASHAQPRSDAPNDDAPVKEPTKLSLDELSGLAEQGSDFGRPPEMTFPTPARDVFKVQDQWALFLKQPKVLTNSLDMKLALIPPGHFVMGSEFARTTPAHDVTITRPFYIGVYEVTQQEYTDVVGNNPSAFAAGGKRAAAVAGRDTRRYPVEQLRHTAALRFCKLLSERPEEKKLRRLYRLPTEAEWEYACRAGTDTTFHFGSTCNGTNANVKGTKPHPLDHQPGPYLDRTRQVGSYQPNAFGLYDMHGNVAEMCADSFDAHYYRTSPQKDPQGPKNRTGTYVLRSGGFNWGAGGCASPHRHYYENWEGWPSKGFRVVCEIRAASAASAPGTTDNEPD